MGNLASESTLFSLARTFIIKNVGLAGLYFLLLLHNFFQIQVRMIIIMADEKILLEYKVRMGIEMNHLDKTDDVDSIDRAPGKDYTHNPKSSDDNMTTEV